MTLLALTYTRDAATGPMLMDGRAEATRQGGRNGIILYTHDAATGPMLMDGRAEATWQGAGAA